MRDNAINFATAKRRTVNSRSYAKSANNARRRRRRTGRRTLHYLLIFIVASVIMVILSLTVFFKIENLDVTGTTRYAKEEIIAATGVELGDNLFSMNDKKIIKTLKSQFPYIEEVNFKRSFPANLTFEIEQAQAMSILDTPDGYIIVGKNGRILEIGTQNYPQGVMVINGIRLFNPEVGNIMGQGKDYEDEEQEEAEKTSLKMLLSLQQALEETGFQDITYIDFSDRFNIWVIYQDRIIIDLGTESNLTYKLRFVQEALAEKKLADDFEGIFDVANASSSGKLWARPLDIQMEIEARRPYVQPTEPDNKPEDSESGNPDEDPQSENDTPQSEQENDSNSTVAQ